MFQPVNKLRYAPLRLLKLAEDVYLNSEIWPPSNSTPVEGSVGPTGWPPVMLPGPSKGSQPYAPKCRGNINWPKDKGPRPVLVIF